MIPLLGWPRSSYLTNSSIEKKYKFMTNTQENSFKKALESKLNQAITGRELMCGRRDCTREVPFFKVYSLRTNPGLCHASG